jgi:hypothetical protein
VSTDTHDYRECFYDTQPDRGRPAQVCDRFPCRVYREGYQHGYADGNAAGYGAGYGAGYAAGMASCPGSHGGG